jgi:outer membrane protein assembly factor BamB
MTTTVWTQNPFGGDCIVYASPIVVGDTLYVLNGSGVCYALDASKTYSVLGTGTLEALDPLAESGYWATPAFAGNKIYIRGVNHLYCISN